MVLYVKKKKKKRTLVFQVSLSLFISSFLELLVIFLLKETKTPLEFIFLIGISSIFCGFDMQKQWDTAGSSTDIYLKNILHQTTYASTLHSFHCIGYLLSLLLYFHTCKNKSELLEWKKLKPSYLKGRVLYISLFKTACLFSIIKNTSPQYKRILSYKHMLPK